MTNIFQFLKQGTSLSRKVLGENRSLEEDLLLKQRVRNDDFDVHGKFHLSDSEEEDAPKNNDP